MALVETNDLIALSGFVDQADMITDLAERDQVLRWIRHLLAAPQAVTALNMDGYRPERSHVSSNYPSRSSSSGSAGPAKTSGGALVTQIRADAEAEEAERETGLGRHIRTASRPQSGDPSSDELTALRALDGLPRRQREVFS